MRFAGIIRTVKSLIRKGASSLVPALFFALSLGSAWPPVSVLAAEGGGSRGYVSLLGGVGFPSSSSSVFTFGANGAYKLNSKWGVGAFYQHYGIGVSVVSSLGSAAVDSSNSLYGVEGISFLPDSLKGFMASARMGLASVSTTASASSADGGNTFSFENSTIKFFVAPRISYDYYINRFSIGLELTDYFMIAGPSMFSGMVTAKFWF